MSPPPFEVALDEHGAVVMRVLHRLLGRADAEDAWQDTFIAALRAYPRLCDGSDVRAWLLTIAHRKAIDRFRARARQPLPVADADGPAPGTVEAEVGVTATVDLGGASVGLWSRVRMLPEKQRLAVGYRFGADLSYADIASLLECSPAAARRSVFEGLRTLRHQLTEEELPT